MTTAGTYYYPPSAGTGNLLLTNPPFAMGNPRPSHLNDYLTYALHMDTNQPTPAEGLPELTEEQFQELSGDTFVGCSGRPVQICSHEDALRIARAAYLMGADVELEACRQWLLSKNSSKFFVMALRDDRRPKPPSLREQALAILDDCSDRLDAAHENTIRRALEALPE